MFDYTKDVGTSSVVMLDGISADNILKTDDSKKKLISIENGLYVFSVDKNNIFKNFNGTFSVFVGFENSLKDFLVKTDNGYIKKSLSCLDIKHKFERLLVKDKSFDKSVSEKGLNNTVKDNSFSDRSYKNSFTFVKDDNKEKGNEFEL